MTIHRLQNLEHVTLCVNMAGRLRGWLLNNALCETRYKSCVLNKTFITNQFSVQFD